MKRSALLLAALAALLLFAGVYLWIPARTPPSQKPLVTLSIANFSELEAAFDESPDAPRLLLLLSPT